jgi:sugar/nucleoside kinase (ribokinase family)
MPRFLLVGGATVDFYAYCGDLERIEIDSKARQELVCLPFGSKTTLQDLHVHPGGSAANSAITLNQLGSKASLLAAVGADPVGKMLLASLKHHGISSGQVSVIPGCKTSMSVVLRVPSGEKSILTYRGANDFLSKRGFNPQSIQGSDVVILTSLPSASNYQLFLQILKVAEKQHKLVAFAPSISMLTARKKELATLHERFDLAIMNTEEAEAYTASKNIKSAIHRLPGKVKVVTDASNGAYALAGGQLLHVPAAKVKVVDTTGAGDSFTAAFAHYYFTQILKAVPTQEACAKAATFALRCASAVAGLKLQHEGAHFTKREKDVEKFLQTHPELKVNRIV